MAFRSGAGWRARRIICSLGLTLLAVEPLAPAQPAWQPASQAGSSRAAAAPLPGMQARVLHALNRLTFGPRPGDVEEVSHLGLDPWFEQQLHPDTIEDGALEARLAQWPAAKLSVAQLEAQFPGVPEIRAMRNGKASLPLDPTQRLLAQDEIAIYQLERARRETGRQGPHLETAASVVARPGQMAPPPSSSGVDSSMDDGSDGAGRLTSASWTRLCSLAPDERVQAILHLRPEELVSLRQRSRRGGADALLAGMSPGQKETVGALGGANRMVAREAMETRMVRDLYSNRQLEAVMTDFWLHHFNVYVKKNQNEAFLLSTFERETIRKHALGNFEDLLDAVAMSPAMLEYLDNVRSTGPDSPAGQLARTVGVAQGAGGAGKPAGGLNENYARELMELHTLGVNGGYTQADVTQVAEVFTGWTLESPVNSSGEFVFRERKHEPGTKLVLGHKIPEGGANEGLAVLHLLATSPATAHFLSEKLAVRFVSDEPPPALVNRMAQSFLSSHGDIRTVLRTMFHSPEFWSPSAEHAKVKTPEEFVLSAVRATGAEVTDPAALVTALDRLGMPLYGMQTPNGYGWTKQGWVSTGALVTRMNFALALAGGQVRGTEVPWNRLLDDGASGTSVSASPTARKERTLERVLLAGVPVSDRTRQTVLAQADRATMPSEAATQLDLLRGDEREAKASAEHSRSGVPAVQRQASDPEAAVMAGLLLGSPEFQRR